MGALYSLIEYCCGPRECPNDRVQRLERIMEQRLEHIINDAGTMCGCLPVSTSNRRLFQSFD